MEESTSREKVLKNVREALISKTDAPFPKVDHEKPLFRGMSEPEDINFAQELTATGGQFIYCESENEFLENLQLLIQEKKLGSIYTLENRLKEILEAGRVAYISGKDHPDAAKAGITGCEFLVARTGSVMVSSAQGSGRKLIVFPEVHLVAAYASQLVPDLKDALAAMKKKYDSGMPSMVTLITGPSRTADIEKTLVIGAHGPRELYVFFIEDRSQI